MNLWKRVLLAATILVTAGCGSAAPVATVGGPSATAFSPTAVPIEASTPTPFPTSAPTPTAVPTPPAQLLGDLIAAVRGQAKEGQIPKTSAGAVSAAVRTAFADPGVAAWAPPLIEGPVEQAISRALDGCDALVIKASDETAISCSGAGRMLYKAYQKFQTPPLLDAFNTFLYYILTRSDMRKHYPSDNPETIASEFLDGLSNCITGIGQVNWCEQDWDLAP